MIYEIAEQLYRGVFRIEELLSLFGTSILFRTLNPQFSCLFWKECNCLSVIGERYGYAKCVCHLSLSELN